MIELDVYDYKLLAALRKDSRLSLRELGSCADLSAPAVASRVKRLEALGVIKGYSVILSESAFALEVEALCFTKVPFIKTKDYLSYMEKSLCVSSLVKVASEYSYMAVASFKNISSLNSFHNYLEEHFGPSKVQILLKKEFINRAPLTIQDPSKLV